MGIAVSLAARAAEPATLPEKPPALETELARRPRTPNTGGPRVVGWADGGFDAWTGGGGPAWVVGGSVEAPGPSWAGWGWARLELVDDPSGLVPLDGFGAGASAELCRIGRLRGGLTGAASGSVSVGWGEGLVSVDGRTGGLGGRLGLSLGAGGRGADVGGAALGRATLDYRLTRGWWSSEVGATVSAYVGVGPPVVADGSAWLALGRGEGARLELGIAGVAVPDSTASVVAGLPPPGTVVGRATVAGVAQIVPNLDARIELAPELARGTFDYERLRAMVGVRLEVGRRPPPAPPSRKRHGDTRFTLRDRRAASVELLAGFADWTPIAMVRGRSGRWRVDVAVPPGRWPYAYRVDGAVVTPPEARQRADDGFGGVNGVLVVP